MNIRSPVYKVYFTRFTGGDGTKLGVFKKKKFHRFQNCLFKTAAFLYLLILGL